MSNRLLRNLSLGYLLAPNIIFIFNWFRPIISIPTICCLIVACWVTTRSKENNAVACQLAWKEILFLSSGGILVTALSGVDGYFSQFFDFWGHNAKYYTVYSHEWPVFFEEPQQYASYYFGMYIIPALISQLWGAISGGALFVYAALGYTLALCWIYIASHKHYWFLLLFFVLGSAGHLLKLGFFYLVDVEDWSLPFVVEIWSIFYQSQHAFNQLIPTLLVAGVLFYDYKYKKAPERSFLFVTLHFIFGVFPTITLFLASMLLIGVQYYDRLNSMTIKKISMHLIWAGLAVLPTFVYFLSGGGVVVKGFIWQFATPEEIFKHYFFGIVIELLLIGYLFYLARPYTLKDKLIIAGLLVLLLLSSNYRIGKWNDWFMRGNMPLFALVLLFLVDQSPVLLRLANHLAKYSFYLICLVSMLIPLKHLSRALQHNYFISTLFPQQTDFTPIPYDKFNDLYQMGKVIYSDQEAAQYAGAKDSWYAKYLAPKK